jgi:hypothetical protein
MNLAAHTKKWINRQNISCIGFVIAFLREAGFDVPDGAGYVGPTEAGYISVDTYESEWWENPVRVEQNMVRAIIGITEKSSTRFPKIYDLLVVQQKADRRILFPAVYVGGGKAMASFARNGVQPFRLDAKNRCILARRFK